jgi:hypothetical protein
MKPSSHYTCESVDLQPYAGRWSRPFHTFRHQKDLSPSSVIETPVWTVDQEVGRRKKTIYVTCIDKNCLAVNKLDGRKIRDDGVFQRPGCFMCRRCGSSFRPFLEGWRPEHRKSTKAPRLIRPVEAPVDGTNVATGTTIV